MHKTNATCKREEARAYRITALYVLQHNVKLKTPTTLWRVSQVFEWFHKKPFLPILIDFPLLCDVKTFESYGVSRRFYAFSRVLLLHLPYIFYGFFYNNWITSTVTYRSLRFKHRTRSSYSRRSWPYVGTTGEPRVNIAVGREVLDTVQFLPETKRNYHQT